MIKSFAAVGIALAAAAPSAIAGPYVNVEHTHDWVGSDAKGGATEMHVGFSTKLDPQAEFYVQGGATYLSPDAADGEAVPSAKAGLNLSDVGPVNIYGEVSFTGSGEDDVDRNYQAKVGVRYDL